MPWESVNAAGRASGIRGSLRGCYEDGGQLWPNMQERPCKVIEKTGKGEETNIVLR